ncbi:MAG: heme ABC exporter ATP-binding protein CcmA [Nitrospirales bacterium]
MIAIQATNLSKAYGFYRIFEELSFDLLAGDCFALFGPNGAGKTTLLRVLATLQQPSSGHFSIFGQDGVGEKELVRQSLMVIAHGSHLYEELTGFENLQFALALRGQPIDAKTLKHGLDRVGIGAFADLKVRQYSAGMKKRLALAKVVIARPKLLLLDEPYNALDEAGVIMTNLIIQQTLQGEGAVLMTTHDRDKAAQVATRGAILQSGHMQLLTQAELR